MSETFVTIARYQYSTEAQIIKGRLESEDIKVFLSDNITIDTDPLVSNAIGGVKLKVLKEDKTRAKTILSDIKKYSVDDNGQAISCPNCGSQHIEMYSTITNFRTLVHFLIGFVFGTLPFSTRYQYKCEDCKTEFPIK